MSSDLSPVRLAVVGQGRWGKTVIRVASSLPGFKLTALRTSQPAEPGRPDVRHFEFDSDLFAEARKTWDALMVCTPPDQHFRYVDEALAKDLPVFVEKPLALCATESVKLRARGRTSKSPVLVDHIHLYHPAWSALLREVKNQEIIKILTRGGNVGPFRSYSPLWDYGSHDVSMVLALTGEAPKSLECWESQVRPEEAATAKNYEFRMEFAGGIVSESKVGNLFREKQRITEVHLRSGSGTRVLVYDDLASERLREHQLDSNGMVVVDSDQIIPTSTIGSLEFALKEFHRRVVTKEAGTKDLELGCQVVEVLERLEKASGSSR